MKTVVLYESKKGYTEECAKYISRRVEDCDVFEIHDFDKDLNEYDNILIGSPIYEGEIGNYTEDFFSRKKHLLLDKRLGIFCAAMNSEEFNKAMQERVPVEVFIHAKIIHCGGQVDFETLKRKEKRILKKRLGITKSESLKGKSKLDDLVKWVENNTEN